MMVPSFDSHLGYSCSVVWIERKRSYFIGGLYSPLLDFVSLIQIFYQQSFLSFQRMDVAITSHGLITKELADPLGGGEFNL